MLFDGECAMCSASVQFLVDRDVTGRLHFAPLQSPLGRLLRRDRGVSDSVDSVVLVEGDAAYTRSDAALRLARYLPWRWRWLRIFVAIPAPVRDWVYGIVAANRKRWFGTTDACRMATPALRARLLG